MRIIAGNLKGRKLHSICGNTIRPTSDRLRESLFNILSGRIRDTAVLELFAGTGALGIEALSREAKSVVFIDKFKDAILTIKKNIQTCKLENKTKIINWDIEKNLNCLRTYQSCFNMVFMEPPYNKNLIKPALHNIYESRVLTAKAIIVIEHSKEESIPENIPGFNIFDRRKYGKTLVSFMHHDITAQSKSKE